MPGPSSPPWISSLWSGRRGSLRKTKRPKFNSKLDETLYTAAEAVRIVCGLIAPVLPHSAEKIWQQLGFTQPVSEIQIETLKWGGLPARQHIGPISAVFPRLDAKPTIEKMQELEAVEKQRQAELVGQAVSSPTQPRSNRKVKTALSPSMISPRWICV